MSKRDYEATAKIMRDTNASLATILAMADMFAARNERFNRDMFVKACGR